MQLEQNVNDITRMYPSKENLEGKFKKTERCQMYLTCEQPLLPL